MTTISSQVLSLLYIMGHLIRFQTPTVKEEIRHCSSQYSACISVHLNGLAVNLMVQADNRRLRRHMQTICLPDSLSNKSHYHRPQQAYYLSFTDECYWTLFHM
jgi:hypothetical protein